MYDINSLRRFNIEITALGVTLLGSNGEVEKSYYKYLYPLDWIDGNLSAKQLITLALAVTQEMRNNFLDVSEVAYVNNILGLDITFNDIQKATTVL